MKFELQNVLMHKFLIIKSIKQVRSNVDCGDVVMKETSLKIERVKQYIYTDQDRRNHFYLLIEKLMTPMKTAKKATNVNYHTARK